MSDEIEDLLARALREESRDRRLAVHLYRRVAESNSGHATYATNCIQALLENEALQEPPEPVLTGNAWRKDKLLVVRLQSPPESCCVITGETSNLRPITISDTQVAGYLYLLSSIVLLSPLWLIVARLFRSGVAVKVQAGEKARKTSLWYRLWFVACWCFIAILVYLAPLAQDNPTYLAILLFTAILSGNVSLYFLAKARLLTVAWVRGEYIALTGGGTEYLKSLPVFPLTWNNGRWWLTEAPIAQ